MDRTVQAYDQTNYLEWRLNEEVERKRNGQPTFWEPELLYFLSLVSNRCLVEIGAGPGVEAEYLLNHGNFDSYTGIEPALKLANYAKRRLKKEFGPKVNIKTLTLQQFEPRCKYQALLAICSLIHIKNIRKALCKLRSICSDGAFAMFVMDEGRGSVKVRTNTKGMTFYYYTYAEFVELLQESRFTVLDKSGVVERAKVNWQVYYVRAV